jgi:hypothetical protein
MEPGAARPGLGPEVDRPWQDLEFDRAAAPSLLLRPEFGVVDYAFRDAELATAREWCRASPEPQPADALSE